VQGQCKLNAIELARIAEAQPVLADFIGKGMKKSVCLKITFDVYPHVFRRLMADILRTLIINN
jgi:hypothetical protein